MLCTCLSPCSLDCLASLQSLHYWALLQSSMWCLLSPSSPSHNFYPWFLIELKGSSSWCLPYFCQAMSSPPPPPYPPTRCIVSSPCSSHRHHYLWVQMVIVWRCVITALLLDSLLHGWALLCLQVSVPESLPQQRSLIWVGSSLVDHHVCLRL